LQLSISGHQQKDGLDSDPAVKKAFSSHDLECKWRFTDGTNSLSDQGAKMLHAIQALELFL
jgi:hypothetical protein